MKMLRRVTLLTLSEEEEEGEKGNCVVVMKGIPLFHAGRCYVTLLTLSQEGDLVVEFDVLLL